MSEKKAIIFILVIVLLAVLLMLPLRNQVYEDDFVFAYPIEQLINNGRFTISQYSVPLLLPIFWGSLFSLIFGYSFKTLHFSTFIFLPILAIAIFKLARSLNISIKNSFILTLFFFSIPWIFQYSMMFMTEIPFLTLEVMALFFYHQGIKKGDKQRLFLGSIFSSLTFFTRPLGIILPIATAIVFLISAKNRPFTKTIKNILLAVGLPITAFIFYSWFMSIDLNKTIELYNYQESLRGKIITLNPFGNLTTNQAKLDLAKLIFDRSIKLFNQTLGIFTPLLIIITISNLDKVKNNLKKNKPYLLIPIIIFLIIGLEYLINRQYSLAYPHTLYRYERLLPIPWAHLWKFLVAIGIVLLPLISQLSFSEIKKIKPYNLFLLLSFLGITILSITSFRYWNKYIIPLLPFVLILIGAKTKNWNLLNKFTLTIVLILLLDSVQLTKLRYDQNGISQQKGIELIKAGVSPDEILPNTNYAWTFWFTYEDKIAQELAKVNENKKLAKLPRVDEDKKYLYVINAKIDMQRPLPDANYNIIETINFRSLLVKSQVFVLKRTD